MQLLLQLHLPLFLREPFTENFKKNNHSDQPNDYENVEIFPFSEYGSAIVIFLFNVQGLKFLEPSVECEVKLRNRNQGLYYLFFRFSFLLSSFFTSSFFVSLLFSIKFTNNLVAPSTPAGNSLKKDNPVYTYFPFPYSQ